MKLDSDGHDEEAENNIYNALFESIKDCGILLNKKGNIQDVNENTLRYLGYDKEDLIQKPILDFTPPGAATKAYDKFWELTPEFNRATFETKLYKQNKEEITVEVSCHFLGRYDNVGEVLMDYRDITLRKTIENKIENRKDQYKTIVETSPDGYLLLATDGKIQDTNEAYAKLSGYSQKKLKTMNYFDLAMGKKGDIPENSLFNNFHKTKSGDIIPVKVKVSRFKDENNIDTVIMFVYSINEYLQLITKLKEERKIMEKILAGLTKQDLDGILIYKIGAGIRFTNEVLQNAFGYTNEEFEKMHLTNIYHPEDFDTVSEGLASVFDKVNDKFTSKSRFMSKGGEVIEANVEVTNRRDEDGNYLGVFLISNIVVLDESVKKIKEHNIHEILSTYDLSKTTGILIAKIGDHGYIYANSYMQENIGYNQVELNNIEAIDLIHPNDFSTMKKNAIKVVLGFTKKAKFKGCYIRKDGGIIEADHIETKYKDKKSKRSYLVLQLDNIVQKEILETTN
ncbi:MAG: PAS domain S-box protein [Leptospirales bacterium]